MKMQLIAFVGQAESGKTLACNMLTRMFYEAGFFPKNLSFAGPLKREVAAANGYQDWALFKKEHPDLYRSQCQAIGAAKRQESQDYWVDRWESDLTAFVRDEHYSPVVILVDDVRYPNEIDRVIKLGGQVVYIDAGDRLPNPDAPYRTHESETMARDLAGEWKNRVYKTPGDVWSPKINIGIDNSWSVDRLQLRLKDLMEVWTAVNDIAFTESNKFAYALARDYQVAYSTLKNSDILELTESGLSDDLIYRYAPRTAAKTRRSGR